MREYIDTTSFKVKYTSAETGETVEASGGEFVENTTTGGLTYSNYMVKATAVMKESSTGDVNSNTSAYDWLIYTNARVDSDVTEESS